MKQTAHTLNPRLLFVNHIGRGNMPTDVDTFGDRVTRWHELDIITWGNGIDHVWGQSYPVRAGDVFYRVPGLKNRHDLPYHCYFFVFDPYYMPEHEPLYKSDPADRGVPLSNVQWEPIAPFAFSTEPYLGSAADTDYLSSLAANIFVEFSSNKSDPLYIKTMFLQLLCEAARQVGGNGKMRAVHNKYAHYRQRIMEITLYIRDNPQLRHPLNEMAERANLSPNFFCKVFRELTGETLVAYANRIKINYVKMQLIDSEKTVGEIAEDCGFGDPNYLYTLFRKETGHTPMDYRKGMISRMMR